MLKKVLLFALMLLCTVSSCYANLLDNKNWRKVEGIDSYFGIKGIEYSSDTPKTGTLLQGYYFEKPISEQGVYNISYWVYEAKYYENDKNMRSICNYVLYDANGDILAGRASESSTVENQNNLYDCFFGSEPINYFGEPGKGDKGLFLSPTRWKCLTGNNSECFLYDAKSVQRYEKDGEKLINVWVCSAEPWEKKYSMSYMAVNPTKKTIQLYNEAEFSYGNHQLISKHNNNGIKIDITSGTALEILVNKLAE